MSEAGGTGEQGLTHGEPAEGPAELPAGTLPMSKLAVASLVLVAGPMVVWGLFCYALTDVPDRIVCRTMVAAWLLPVVLAVVALRFDIPRRGRRGKALARSALGLSAVYPVAVGVLVWQALSNFGKGEVDYHLMPRVPALVHRYMEQTGQPPDSVDDLVDAGLLEELPVCGFDESRRSDPSIGGSSWALAPLDGRFLNGFDQSPLLCVHCTVEHQFGPEHVIVLGFDDARIQAIERGEFEEWVGAQTEALGWLEESVPLVAVEQIAGSSEGHRRELAVAVVGYRLRREAEPRRAPEESGSGAHE